MLVFRKILCTYYKLVITSWVQYEEQKVLSYTKDTLSYLTHLLLMVPSDHLRQHMLSVGVKRIH